MKKTFIVALVLCCSIIAYAANPIKNYDGEPLEMDRTWKRTQVGKAAVSDLAEISGLACSRVTPGYLWCQGDDSYYVKAMLPDGTFVSSIKVAKSHRDWEDLCGGVYNDTNYLFVGIFGDNGLRYKDKYYIYYFKEPEIVEGDITVEVDTIHFGYPDGVAHNAETLMFDNVEKVLYIVDKYDNEDAMGVVYSLPFRTDYEGMQVLKEECKLGNGANFMNPTGGDISPDGKYIIVKNEAFMLIWTREEGESVGTAMARRPLQVDAYRKELQGEAIAWLDSTLFYTTSDMGSGSAPIFQYTKLDPNSIENVAASSTSKPYKIMDMNNHMVQIHHGNKTYSLLGNIIE